MIMEQTNLEIDLNGMWNDTFSLPTFHEHVHAALGLAAIDNPTIKVPQTLYRFNTKSSTGPWLPKMTTKNGELHPGTLEMNAEQIITKLMSLGTYDEMVKWLLQNQWTCCPIVKPKREIILLTDVL